jgi:asparagine synthetase A
MGKMKEVRSVIEDMLSNGFYTYESIAVHLFAQYRIDNDYAMELIEAVIDQWDAEEMQMEINFESKTNA